MGGDILPGTDFVDALTLFEHHEDTKGIILVGEIGGEAELTAADWIREYRKRTKHPKYCQLFVIARSISNNDRPVMTLIAGFQAPFGTVMGHAGAFARSESEHGNEKVKALIREGGVITNHPSKFGTMMKRMLDDPDPTKWRYLAGENWPKSRPTSIGKIYGNQRRGIHVAAGRLRSLAPQIKGVPARQGHFLTPGRSLKLLEEHRIPTTPDKTLGHAKDIIIRIGIDRLSGRLQATITSPGDVEDELRSENFETGIVVPLDELFRQGSQDEDLDLRRRAPASFYLRSRFPHKHGAAISSSDPTGYLPKLMRIFINEETFSLYTRFRKVNRPERFFYDVIEAQVGLDALVYEGPKLSPEVIGKRGTELPNLSREEMAAKDGIVYVKLEGPGSIGTLGKPTVHLQCETSTNHIIVNGAGLAMNTVDAVADLGGECANFLDTGGKATSATVKTSFQLVLSDPRVKVIFVNIFGGLTLCDMIAGGMMLAYKDLGITVPVIVRLRGTNEEIGQKMIAESGLPLHAFDDFEEAALKAIELAQEPPP
ncbi:MAG: hypothetical protein Q9225_001943 [Loekoesia sp. 1 TL-2023]